ncbi:MAG TPA: DUF1990 domain-containing protein [Actinocrinis sp.]|jgi:uncharacterized protein (UPF0548 family)|uniref:DUF1990 family protein n=1 Tax=Actinocrinis sp. TaxID=1920516 RepID=UPI002DDD99F7|nr:DUF1990 domain-containing protein [Actinocrinis sp.]HEV3172674.1 DUF1990 domain-containing protein [Actinocrinis sp.]
MTDPIHSDHAHPHFTYPELAATRDPSALPPGYNHLHHRAAIGTGRRAFTVAGSAVVEWRMHEGMHVRPKADAPRAEPGVSLTLTLGAWPLSVTAPCRVVWTVDTDRAIGFAYGTLPGHPERGEEAFLVELADDGTVHFTITAFSRPGAWYTQAAGPVVPVLQRAYARACAKVLRRVVSRA